MVTFSLILLNFFINLIVCDIKNTLHRDKVQYEYSAVQEVFFGFASPQFPMLRSISAYPMSDLLPLSSGVDSLLSVSSTLVPDQCLVRHTLCVTCSMYGPISLLLDMIALCFFPDSPKFLFSSALILFLPLSLPFVSFLSPNYFFSSSIINCQLLTGSILWAQDIPNTNCAETTLKTKKLFTYV